MRYFNLLAAGALSILAKKFIMKRITRDWSLSLLFLKAVAGSANMIAAIPEDEEEKRQVRYRSSPSVYFLSILPAPSLTQQGHEGSQEFP